MRFGGIFLVGLLLLPALPAMAQYRNLFPVGPNKGLTSADTDAMLSSINVLNRDPRVAVGSSESWRNAATGSHGTSSVTQILQRDGLTCHLVHQEIFVRGAIPARVYNFTWCLTHGGDWKIAN